MESNSPDAGIGDKFDVNGDCSPTSTRDTGSFNHAKNIDDISTPSELKFDEGIVNKCYFDQFSITVHYLVLYFRDNMNA